MTGRKGQYIFRRRGSPTHGPHGKRQASATSGAMQAHAGGRKTRFGLNRPVARRASMEPLWLNAAGPFTEQFLEPRRFVAVGVNIMPVPATASLRAPPLDFGGSTVG